MSVDISEPVNEICTRLGLEAKNVARLDISPKDLQAEVYKLNEQGSKYVDEDGDPAKERFVFEIST